MFGDACEQSLSFLPVSLLRGKPGWQGGKILPRHFEELQGGFIAIVEDRISLRIMRDDAKRRLEQQPMSFFGILFRINQMSARHTKQARQDQFRMLAEVVIFRAGFVDYLHIRITVTPYHLHYFVR